MDVNDPFLLYRDSQPLPQSSQFATAFEEVLECNQRLYILGSRVVYKEGSYEVQYRDAIGWYLDVGGNWRQTPYEGGIGRVHHSEPAHREFEGGTCVDGRLLAFGHDNWASEGGPNDVDGVLWRQSDQGWERLTDVEALTGPGTQRIMALDVIQMTDQDLPLRDTPRAVIPERTREEYRLVLARGDSEGTQCLLSGDLETWRPVRAAGGMAGWYVDDVTRRTFRCISVPISK